jgi:hypothetical protein
MDGVDSDGDGSGDAVLVSELPQVRLETAAFGMFRTVAVDDFTGDGVVDVATWSVVTPEHDGVEEGQQGVHLYVGPFARSACDVLHTEGLFIDVEGDVVDVVQAAGDVDGDESRDLLVSNSERTTVVSGPIQTDVVLDDGSPLNVWASQMGEYGAAAAVGDVDADEFADVAQSAFSYEHGSYIYLLFGQPLMNFVDRSPSWVEPDASVLFGFNLSGVGDMSGDGIPDIAAGAASGIWGETGFPTYVFTSVPDAPTHPRDDSVVIVSEYGEGDVAAMYEPAGDVNGDGYGDMAIVGSGWTGVTVFFGPLRDDGSPIAWESANALFWFGYPMAVEARGDVDGDGFDDLALASTLGSLQSCPEGSCDPDCEPGLVHLVAGPQEGVVEPADMIQGYGSYGGFGSSMGGKNDLDGDGHKDLVVAGDDWVYVLFGL